MVSLTKFYLSRAFRLFLILCFFLSYGNAVGQYADLGNGSLKNKIWWINWANFDMYENAVRVIPISPDFSVSLTFSNVSGVIPQPSTMNTWIGSILPLMYNFSNSGRKPALLTTTTTGISKFTVTVRANRNGVPVPLSLVIADAEASSSKEQLRLTTNGSNFKTIEFYRNSSQTSNPFIGCNTNSGYFTDTQDESVYPVLKGQCPLVLTESDGDPLVIDVVLDRSVYGASAIAFGIIRALDRGDLPSSYGYAHHSVESDAQNTCNYNPPFPAFIENSNIYLGNVPPDADANESLDDNAEGADEDAISVFPDYNNSGTYTLQIPLRNTTAKPAYLSGWFDYNQDGIFDINEFSTAIILPNTTSGTLSWQHLPAQLETTEYAFRFRISSDKNAAEIPTGFAPDGEVEDYLTEIKTIINDSLVINDYAAIINYDICNNRLLTDNAYSFNAGDTVLLIQMKGAVIDSSNSASFGNISDYKDAGNYEFNIVQSKSGNAITLLNKLTRIYDFTNGKVQLVRVPYYSDVTFDRKLTCLPWNGSTGGVLCLNASGMITLQNNIDVSGKGFRHGGKMQSTVVTSNAIGYFYDAASNNGAEKGEGIYTIADQKKYGRGALANGGGGGNAHNAGGGGGGNGGMGGRGGDQYEPMKSISEKVGGKEGHSLNNSASINKLFLGGAGGMGHANDLEEFPAGNGGGIVIVNGKDLNSNGYSIFANGENGAEAPTPEDCKDGMPGGGAGGTILLSVQNVTSLIILEAKGGNGANQTSVAFNGRHGTGGGGGGGIIAVSQPLVPVLYSTNVSGGMNGVNVAYGNDPWDATPGQPGKIISGFQITTDDNLFKPNIDSVRIADQIADCQIIDFNGLAYVQNFPINQWLWDFGDNSGSNVQSPVHDFASEGTFDVKLVVTDVNGCKDSIQTIVNTLSKEINAGPDTSVCQNTSVNLYASGGGTYSWTPSETLDDASIAQPIATPSTTTKYFLTVTKSPQCIITDSVLVTVNLLPVITASSDTTVCIGAPVQVFANGGASYVWSPANSLDDANTPSPTATPSAPTTYHVGVMSAEGCFNEDSVKVLLFPDQKIRATAPSLICKNGIAELSATGGSSFVWSPAPLVTDPSAQITLSTALDASSTFYLTATDNNGCSYNDSVQVKIRPEAIFEIHSDSSVCKNSTVTLTASGGDAYEWNSTSEINDPSGNTISSVLYENTTFSVIVSENTCGKTDTLYRTVNVSPLPAVNASSSNDISCTSSSTRLSAGTTGKRFNWFPETGLDHSEIQNPIASPTTNTLYIVTVTDNNNCKNSDSVFVKVNYSDKRFLGLPNAFTPNGDGLNDCFGVQSLAPLSDLDFRIFNRFGELVFQTNNPNTCWDGTYKGKPQDAGVYVYIVTGTTICAPVNLKGTVTLIR